MLVQSQEDIDRLDGGASAYVYAVNAHVVLKSPVIFIKPTQQFSQIDQYEYALQSVCHYDDIQNERDILRLLERFPHPNIVQVIALEHPEGIYLRRHFSLSRRLHVEKPALPIRLTWYRDMLRALTHLHQFEIAHADIRVDNFLLDWQDTVVLCDFTCSRPFGQENPSATEDTIVMNVNGLSQIVSDITDRFALASVIFEIETGARPVFSNTNNILHPPATNTGDERLDLILYKAWFKKYSVTVEMLSDIESLLGICHAAFDSLLDPAAIENLRAEIDNWRNVRKQKFGHILNGLCTEEQIEYMRHQLT